MLRALGATPVVVDALDAGALVDAVRSASPTHVIHQLTALPKAGPKSAADLEPTNRLRDDGTRNLLRAALAAGATRLVGGSFALIGAAPSGVAADSRWLLRLALPYIARLLEIRLPLSNAKATAELGWRPQYSTIHEGLAHMFNSRGMTSSPVT
jgi:nucleoside-diphosphate-sugar epimerase